MVLVLLLRQRLEPCRLTAAGATDDCVIGERYGMWSLVHFEVVLGSALLRLGGIGGICISCRTMTLTDCAA